MRILMALTYYHPHWTGLTAYAQRLAEGLAARGHQVTVLTSRYRDDLAPEEEDCGVRVVRLSSWLRLSRGQVMPGFVSAAWRLLRENDVVQCHTPMLETWAMGALAHRLGRKLLMTHHGDLVMPAGPWNQFVQATVGWLLDRGAACADAISIHSQDYADHSVFLKPYAPKISAIYPPVEIPRPDPLAVQAWRRELGLEGYRLVGFAGRFVQEKGFDYLLKAIPAVAAKMGKTKFVYAGDHAVVYEHFYQHCRHLADACKEHLLYLGLIRDQRRLADFYAMCDVFALPSRTDCFPSVQIEAMLCGTPVVATNIPGAREAVRVTGMGLLVEPCDEHALAGGLVECLTRREVYVRTEEQIRSVFCTEKTLLAYERLLGQLAT